MHKLGLIVPYRNREEHLKAFLPYIKKYLADQKIENTIYVIEQEEGKPFNRGKLLNIGALEAASDCDYFVFHDVDMLPELVNYAYQEIPTHLSQAASQFNYQLPYEKYFGGVTLFPRHAFKKINGYSNEYWGWGVEDDDLLYRCHLAGLQVQRVSAGILQSLPHDRVIDESHHKNNMDRLKQLHLNKINWENEGLNSCTYSVLSKDATAERILIKVSI